jgi:hypothetical protein
MIFGKDRGPWADSFARFQAAISIQSCALRLRAFGFRLAFLSAKTKKARTAGKTTKHNKTKKRTKTIRTGASGTDPCAAQQQAFEDAQSAVDDLKNQINDPDLPPEVRRKAERDMRAATIKLTTAQRALDQCRRQNP